GAGFKLGRSGEGSGELWVSRKSGEWCCRWWREKRGAGFKLGRSGEGSGLWVSRKSGEWCCRWWREKRKARKFKKPASPSKKKSLVVVKDPVEKPIKKPAARRQSVGVHIRDTLGVSVSKKKVPAKDDISKGIDLLSEATLLEEALLKKTIKRSKQETNIHQAGGSSKGADLESDVPDEPKGKSIDISDDEDVQDSDDDPQQADDERTNSKNQETNNDEKELDNEFVHTPEDYVLTDDEMNDETKEVDMEEYDRINEELYGYVNVRLTDAEHNDKEKGDADMTDVVHHIEQQLLRLLPYRLLLLRVSDLEKEVKELKNFDHSSALLATIRSEVPTAIKEYIGINLDAAFYKKKSTSKDSSKGKSPTISSKSSEFTKEQGEEPIFLQDYYYAKHDDAMFGNTDMPLDQGEDTGNTDEQPNDKVVPKNDWYKKSSSDTSPDPESNEGKLVDDWPEQCWLNDMAKATKPPLTFYELMHTLIDFSAFAMNHLKIDNITKELLVRLNNPEGHHYPYDLTKPLHVKMLSQGHQIVPVDFFFNNDLEYLRGGSNDKKYTAPTTKSKAASSAQTTKHDDKTKREAKGKSPVESSTGYRNLSAKFEDFSDNNINEDVGAEADFTNLETSITVSRIPTTKVHKDHPVTQIIVAWIEAIRLFLAYASFMGFMVYQMDVKIAFLYGTIEEEVYVYQPPGFHDPDHPDKVYKVVKALYGLHQALRAWYETLANYLLESDKKSASTPINTEKPLLKDPDGEDVDVHAYRLMIGSLMYLTSSRPDIMFAVCACARFQVTPKASHLHAVKRIFRYLKGKPHLGLWYPKDLPFNLVAYSDSDYVGASLDRKSTTGGCQFLRCRLISWQCKNQTIMATSSTEAEYVAAARCCAQVL
nr:uncharacterized mitochondrial protein AtMg00810-like [Tanacetum cinerariifolium]